MKERSEPPFLPKNGRTLRTKSCRMFDYQELLAGIGVLSLTLVTALGVSYENQVGDPGTGRGVF